MSCFYFAYTGNKRTEFKHIEPLLKDLNINKFIEPFCGSCSTSYILSKTKDVEYYLNDLDCDLINFLKDVKINGCSSYFKFCNDQLKTLTKEQHTKQIAKSKQPDHNLFDFFYYNKVYNYRKGLYPDPLIRKTPTYDHTKYNEYDKFIKKSIISCGDYMEIMERFKDDMHALIYLDPPYFDSFNGSYNNYTYSVSTIEDGYSEVKDNTYMYAYFAEFIKTCKCQVILVINKCSILEYLYKPFIYKIYDKKYSTTKTDKNQKKFKSSTQHMIITKVSNHV